MHKEGKVNKGDEKLEEKGLQFCEKSLESLLAQPVICEGMQWEKATSHEAEPVFKFEMGPNRPLLKQASSPTQPDMDQGPRKMQNIVYAKIQSFPKKILCKNKNLMLNIAFY